MIPVRREPGSPCKKTFTAFLPMGLAVYGSAIQATGLMYLTGRKTGSTAMCIRILIPEAWVTGQSFLFSEIQRSKCGLAATWVVFKSLYLKPGSLSRI